MLPDAVVLDTETTDLDVGTAPGSVDSLPVRICSSLEGCSHAGGASHRVPPGCGRGGPEGRGSAVADAKDFRISESCLHRWLKLADVDDGVRPGVTRSESAELRELRKRNKTLEQENEILRRAAAFFAREIAPK